jgi:hypothetical protein
LPEDAKKFRKLLPSVAGRPFQTQSGKSPIVAIEPVPRMNLRIDTILPVLINDRIPEQQ